MKIIRSATIGMSLNIFCRGLLQELTAEGYEVVAVSSPDADLKELGEREQVRTIGIPMQRRISPLRDLLSLWHMYRMLRRERPDIVHSMTPKAGLITMTAAWLARVPVRIHTFTGLVWPTATGISRMILKATDRITCFCATHVIPEGKGVMQDMINGNITRKPLRVLGYGNVRGVDMDYYKDEEPKANSSNELRFLFVGRIHKDKGIRELQEAFQTINHGSTPRATLTLIGPNESFSSPEGRPGGVMRPGGVSDVRPYMHDADVLVLPSYREGFPNVVLEAGAMSLPCIVTDINGSREIISDVILTEGALKICRNGIVVPPHDAEALAQAMQWMIDHPAERQQMASVARQHIATHWSQPFVRQCLKDFYQSL